MKTKNFAAAIAALSLAASVAAVPVSASADDAYTSISGGEVSFEKYLVMKNEATVPNVSFALTVDSIADDEVMEATGTTLAVLKGPAGIKFKSGVADVTVGAEDAKSASVNFKASDATFPETDKESKSIKFVTTSTADEKFAAKTVTLDLSEVSFPEPGIYRYKITEVAAEKVAGVTNDVDPVRYLDVYVKNKTTAAGTSDVSADELEIQGYYIHSGNDAPIKGTADSSKKSTGFSNTYTTNDLEFRKVVTGNQGSKDKYFKITVKLTNPDVLTVSDNDKFMLTGTWDKAPVKNPATKYTAAEMKESNNKESLTYGDLKSDEGYSFYVNSGQLIEIHGIPSGLGYVISEVEEDYTPSVAMNASGDVKTDDKTGEGTDIDTSAKNTVEDTFLKSDAGVIFTNDRAGNIPTGIISTVAGSAGIAAVGLIGIVCGTIIVKKKKSEEE